MKDLIKYDPTQLLKQQFLRLRPQKGKKTSWYEIFQERIPEFVKKMDLVFTKNIRVKNNLKRL